MQKEHKIYSRLHELPVQTWKVSVEWILPLVGTGDGSRIRLQCILRQDLHHLYIADTLSRIFVHLPLIVSIFPSPFISITSQWQRTTHALRHRKCTSPLLHCPRPNATSSPTTQRAKALSIRAQRCSTTDTQVSVEHLDHVRLSHTTDPLDRRRVYQVDILTPPPNQTPHPPAQPPSKTTRTSLPTHQQKENQATPVAAS